LSSRSKARAGGGEVEVVVETLGDEGDGLARHRGARVVVPGALPGERHRVRLAGARGGTVRATSLERAGGGGERAPPACPYFGRCGGCATQHVPPDAEAAWRVERVRRALARRGVEADVMLGHRSPLGARRRLRLVVAAGGAGLRLGYRERRSHRVVDVAVCPIARPELVAAFAPLRRLLAELAAPPAEIALTTFAEGLEVVLRGDGPPGLADRERLAAWAEAHEVARLAVADTAGGPVEPVAVRRPPVLSWPALVVAPPPAAFLQATAEAEAFLQRTVAAGLAGAERVLDLFAGVGTLSAAAHAVGARVDAVERDPAAAAALAAAEPAPAVTVRDLDRRPPTAAELAGVDAVILDPPRRGAAPVAEALAASRVPRVLHVACSPVSFARDAQTLVAGGYRLDRVDVVDQFRFSPAVELVAVFTRA
jgi:23S rRNA (uracil1939-C5)-methyltransferase